jgi:hypothetical protein
VSDPRIEAREYTYVTAFYRDAVPVDERHPLGWAHRSEPFVVMTPYKSQAVPGAEMYAKRFGTPTEIHYYPRNYIKAARQFFEAGRVVEWCIDCDHDQLHCTCERVNRCSCGHTGMCPCAEW